MLAEGTTCVATLKDNRFSAFTLAEVLITLGIIGVVAALTMPALIANHRKNVVENRLKHFYSTINQAITLSEVENGDKNTWQPMDTEDFWNNYLKPYIKYLKTENSENGQYKIVYLPNGSLFAVDIYFSKNSEGSVSYKSYGGHFIFYPEAKNYSVNPNSPYGSKNFRFAFWPNESSATFKYHKSKGVEPYLANWDGDEDALYTNTTYGCNKTGNGSWCTAIIMRNNWKIPDNYPLRY